MPDKGLFKHVSKNAYDLTCGMMHWDVNKRIDLNDLNLVLQNSVSYFRNNKKNSGRSRKSDYERGQRSPSNAHYSKPPVQENNRSSPNNGINRPP